MIFLMCSSFAIFADFKPWKLASDYNTLLKSSSNKDLTTEDTLDSHNQFKDFFATKFDFRRVCASVMGKEAYMSASQSQRQDFIDLCKLSYTVVMADVSINFRDYNFRLNDISYDDEGYELLDASCGHDIKKDIPVTIKASINSSQQHKIINIVINKVNLGLTFRVQFKELYKQYEDVELVMANWTFRNEASNNETQDETSKILNFFGEVLKGVIKQYPEAKRNANLRQEAYNRGVRQGQAAQRARCNNQQGNC